MLRSAIKSTACMILALAVPAMPALASDTDRDAASGQGQEARQEGQDSKVSPLVQASRRVRGEEKDSEAKVYGNDDLEQMFGPPEPAPGADADEAPQAAATDSASSDEGRPAPDALEQMFADEARRKEQASEIAGAEQRVADARQRIADLQKRLLAIKNPLLARPSAPEEGAEEWAAGDAQARVKQTEQEIEAARQALAEAERELSELRSGS